MSASAEIHAVPGPRFGIQLPQVSLSPQPDIEGIREFVGYANQAAIIDDIWVGESLLGTTSNFEPTAILGAVAWHADRLEIGTSMLLASTRSPMLIAKAAGTLDQLAEGRFILGLAAGPPGVSRNGGASNFDLSRAFLESFDLTRRLLDQERVEFDGSVWQASGATVAPRGYRGRRIPMWFGARKEFVCEVLAEGSDGWMGSGRDSVQRFSALLDCVDKALSASRRDRLGFTVSKRVFIAVATKRDRALNRMRPWFRAIYGDPQVAEHASVVGSVERCTEELLGLAEMGTDHILLHPVYDELRQLELLVAEVLPLVRRAGGAGVSKR